MDELVKVLVEPKNALTKQYQRIFEYEDVNLRFTDDALTAISKLAVERKIGARGLRMILEDLMLDIMYQLPSEKNISECVITREVVENKVDPITVLQKAV
jgi:ATP-dependent Clp protease ATP-binding subunit ClpX